jgi:putative nucleotide binding protein
MPNEENALVLDYLAQGRSSDYKREPVAQVIGFSHFTLLEVVPRQTLKIMDKVYVGKDERKEIDHIKRRIGFKDLTATAQAELARAIETIIRSDDERFLGFYNKSAPITIKRHQLELLPGLGKKHMQDLLKERNLKAFESYEDITKRVKLMPDPIQALVKRVIEELEGVDIKYYLFARPPARDKPRFFKPRRFEKREPRP